MTRVKKAQRGFTAVADNTRVKKVVRPVADKTPPTKYKYIDRPVPVGKKPSAADSALYRIGYKRGVKGGKASILDNWQTIEGVREGRENKSIKRQRNGGKTPAWTRSEGKDPKGGLNRKGVASYRAANPGSKLKTAVTTKPSKLKAGSKAASRRKSFCSRMSGMKKKLTSAKTANDPNSRINKSLRKWNC
jgi:hypothetical protein